MFISVIIPVKDDETRLKACLKALERQTFATEKYEVIVVDNGSSVPLNNCVQAFPHVRLLHESKIGSYSARNTGVKSSQGEILAFTDSDCIPDDYWIENGVRALNASKNCGLAGGPIHLFYRDANNPNPIEIYESKSAFPQQKYIEKNKFSATANMFTYRRVFEEVGLFDERLRSGGDQEWGKRVSQAGYRLVYSENIIVNHPARASMEELKKKTLRQTSGLLDIDHLKKGEKTFYIDSYLNWLAYILPSPRITSAILRDRDLTFLTKLEILKISLKVKTLRLSQLIRLVISSESKKYE